MKRMIVVSFCLMLLPSKLFASTFNLDPYFLVGASGMQVEVAGSKSMSPASYVGIGSSLNWLSENIATEFRFGVGGQLGAFNGRIKVFASYFLKPRLDVTQRWSVHALLGVTTMGVTINDADSSDTDLSYGLGIKYYIPNESLSIEGEWVKYHTSTDSSLTSITGMDISGGSLSLVFEYY